jgi:DNA-directed RNA polymerase specialized sigma24 family protein
MDLADERLKLALQSLLPRDRRILEMRAQGVSLVTIAITFKCSRATAYRWASQARQRLCAKLKAAARAGKG